MFARAALRNGARTPVSARLFSQSAVANRKVAVLGASGGIGQPLNPEVTELRLYDIRLAPGVAADLSHINTPAKTTGYAAEDLESALDGAEIVLIPAGVPRKPGMTRDDLFNTNASIVRDLAKACAKVAPKAYLGIISNPVNSTVPIVAEVFKKAGVYDPKRLFGVTTLDTTRAATFLSGIAGSNPETTNVPVIGGHSGVTIVPLLSQAPQSDKVNAGEQYDKLVHRIQFGGDEVVKAKDGAGSATLSMAYAAAVFTEGLLKGLNGASNVTQCAYVESPLFKDQVEFFASPVEFGKEGVKNIPALPKLTEEEQKLLDTCLVDLAKNIKKGVSWVAENP
ncbi:malate dehydrogenase [Malassezia psittaci]|uniref:Malate dehydrogenase n=1 Tax=Malassezia psittaci TaxID=1821823 RepID=A0AAF0FBM1_9BASI|nr:malate dehydrogenase [Malassezia psittaci]